MSRKKRIVVPGVPHHVTQRGVRRWDVFHSDADRAVYLDILKHYSVEYRCLVIGYCLMTNHVHHLMVPLAQNSLRWTFQLTHKRYAEYLNAKNGWSGHAWQQRFYSSPVDEEYFWVTLRYIERNPVEAGMVQRAEQHPWSSAAFHCGLAENLLISKDPLWREKKSELEVKWSAWLQDQDSPSTLERLRKNTFRDLPTGSDRFLDELEALTGIPTRPLKMGRPVKKVD